MAADDIRARMDLMSLGAEDLGLLARNADKVTAALPAALDAAFAQVRGVAALRSTFPDEAAVAAARAAQDAHWGQLMSGRFDRAYVDSAERMGAGHARVGFEPQWYSAVCGVVLENLVSAVAKSDAARRRGFSLKRAPAGDEASALAALLAKVVLFDTGVVAKAYMTAADLARDAEMAEAATSDEPMVVSVFGEGLGRLAKRDTTYRIAAQVPLAYIPLKDDFNAAMQTLQEAMRLIAVNSGGMQTGSREISQAADDLSRRTEQQAATLEETAAALDQITATVRKTADGATKANTVVASAKAEAEKPNLIVCKTTIGQGSPNRANTAKAHGEALGNDEIKLTREALGWA